jgi:hypothetical protein
MSGIMKQCSPVDTARFIRIDCQGSGDYTSERRILYDKSMEELVKEMKELERGED